MRIYGSIWPIRAPQVEYTAASDLLDPLTENIPQYLARAVFELPDARVKCASSRQTLTVLRWICISAYYYLRLKLLVGAHEVFGEIEQELWVVGLGSLD